MPKQSAPVIDNPPLAFVKPPEAAFVLVHIPAPIVDRFEANILLHQRMAHGHAMVLPTDAAVATGAPDFIVPWVRRRPESRRH